MIESSDDDSDEEKMVGCVSINFVYIVNFNALKGSDGAH